MNIHNINIEVVDLEQCQLFVFVAVTDRISEIVNVDFGNAMPVMLRRLTSNNSYEPPWKELIELKYSHTNNWEDCNELNEGPLEVIMKLGIKSKIVQMRKSKPGKKGGLKIFFNKNAVDREETLLNILTQNEIFCEPVKEIKEANIYCVLCVTTRVVEIIGEDQYEEVLKNKLGIICLQRQGQSNLPIEKPNDIEAQFAVFKYSDLENWSNCDNEGALNVLKNS